MKKLFWAILLSVSVILAAGRYIIERDVKGLERDLTASQQREARESHRIAILNAEWSHVTDTHRLKQLAERHQATLQLQPVSAAQMMNLSDYRAKFDAARLAALLPPLPSLKPGRQTESIAAPGTPVGIRTAASEAVPSVSARAVPLQPKLKPRLRGLLPSSPKQQEQRAPLNPSPRESEAHTEIAGVMATPTPPTRPSLAMILGHLRVSNE